MEHFQQRLKSHFDSKLERLKVFHQLGVQVEGWVKGEILYLLDSMQKCNEIESYDREALISETCKAKCDFVVQDNTGTNWLELKFWIMEQRETQYPPKWYFQQDAYLYKDFRKLFDAPVQDHKWAMVMCVNNPGGKRWSEGLHKFSEKFGVSELPTCRTGEFPTEYYFEIFKVNT